MMLASLQRPRRWVCHDFSRHLQRRTALAGEQLRSIMQTTTASLSKLCAIHLFGALMLSVIITASATRALAQNQLIASVASMEDTTAALRIEDVVQQNFRPVGHTVAMGYTTSAQWLRLRILPADDGSDVVLI